MPKLLFIMVACLIFCGGCEKRLLSSEAFTKEYAKKLQTAMPPLTAEIKGDMEIHVINTGGKELSVFLDNAYKEYKLSPNDKDAIMARHMAAIDQAPPTDESPLDTTSVTPIIKDTAWVSEIRESLKSKAPKGVEMIYEALNPELIVLYASDRPEKIKYLTPEELTAAKLDKSQLRELAVANLKRLLTNIQIHDLNGTFMVTAGGNYEASLLLFDELWQGDRMKVDGDYVVAIPSRDMLLATGSNNHAAIQKMRAWAKRTLDDSPYRLTSDLFVYRSGKFTKLEE